MPQIEKENSTAALTYIVIYLAMKLPWKNFDKYGDFSYGLYIYGFPVQQALSFFGFNKYGFVPYFLMSLVIGTLCGILSYHLIEKRFLKLKDIKFKLFNFRPAKN